MSISSTLNLPSWETEFNNESLVPKFAGILAKYASGLRGLTVYPDNSRGGQPLVEIPYKEALQHKGVIFDESDHACKSGVCGI